MNNKNLFKVIIPILAIVVVWQAINLASSLISGPKVVTNTQVETPKMEAPAVLDMFFAAPLAMEKNKTYDVALQLLPKDNKSTDSLEVYLPYDSSLVKISDLTFGPKMPRPTFSKIGSQTVVANFLVSEAGGLKLEKGVETQVLKFKVTPLKDGLFKMSLAKNTLVVEASSHQALPFTVQELNITLR